MNQEQIITIEILLIIVFPLILLYVRNTWQKRSIILCSLFLPLLWYLTYALIHELSHVAGTYLVGGRVVDHQLVSKFWEGDFGHAWIKTEGFTQNWQQLVSTSFPYMLDIAGIIAGVYILKQSFSKDPFVVGVIFMILILRSAFDFTSELTGFLSGNKGDFAVIETIIGNMFFWVFICVACTMSVVSIITALNRFAGFPDKRIVE